MIDAHTHLNLEASDPISEYVRTIKKSEVDAAVLIINSAEETEKLLDGAEALLDSELKIHLAFLLDINNCDYFEENVNFAQMCDMDFSIKLHPRLTNITERDFEYIYNYTKNIKFKNIIVDSFLYGSNKDNICYIELSNYMAKMFPNKNIVMAHFGGIKVLETMLRTRENKNIFYDSSFSINYLKGTSTWMDFQHCILYSSDRVCFGSDTPSFGITESCQRLRDLMGNQPTEFYNKIFHNNARRIYFE